MKKKCLIALLLAMVLLWSTLCPVYAAGQPDRMIGDGYVQGSISTGSYTVTAYASSSVKSVSVSGTLYESGLFGIWHSVASCTNSSQGNRCVATGTYATKSGKSYKQFFQCYISCHCICHTVFFPEQVITFCSIKITACSQCSRIFLDFCLFVDCMLVIHNFFRTALPHHITGHTVGLPLFCVLIHMEHPFLCIEDLFLIQHKPCLLYTSPSPRDRG